MNRSLIAVAACAALSTTLAGAAAAQDVCKGFGPQTPRDITQKAGANASAFPLASAATAMNLCNLHFHVQAEHRGPGFLMAVKKAEHAAGDHGHGDGGGYRCNETPKLTKAQLEATAGGACKGLKPGDTIEVHWVYSSCDVAPGKGLGSCLSPQCGNPSLRVESQVFLVVNDKSALDFTRFDYAGPPRNGVHQAKSLPTKTGTPVVFRGSTTGPDYTDQKCSSLQVTWSVRPSCAMVDISSLQKWCESNVFKEDHGHGVRQLVTAPALLDRIK